MSIPAIQGDDHSQDTVMLISPHKTSWVDDEEHAKTGKGSQ